MSAREAAEAVRDRLRQTFDAAFAAPPPPPAPASVDLIAIRSGADLYAFRLAAIAGLLARKRLMPAAGADPALLGIAGLRGKLVPVYSLARLLGAADADERWWVLVGADSPIAIAFAAFVSHERVKEDALAPSVGGPAHVEAVVRLASGPHALLALDPLARRIARGPGAMKEES